MDKKKTSVCRRLITGPLILALALTLTLPGQAAGELPALEDVVAGLRQELEGQMPEPALEAQPEPLEADFGEPEPAQSPEEAESAAGEAETPEETEPTFPEAEAPEEAGPGSEETEPSEPEAAEPEEPEPGLNPDPVVQPSGQRLSIDGVTVASAAYNCDGSNYFKVRDLSLLLSGTPAQFQVGFDPERNAVVLTTGAAYEPIGGELAPPGTPKLVTVSDQSLIVNGEPAELDAYNIDGSNYFKLRDLAEVVGFSVDYEAETNTAVILTGSADPYPYASVLCMTTTALDGTLYCYNTYNGLEAFVRNGAYYKPDGTAMNADETEDYTALTNARNLLPQIITDDMTDAQKLQACFDWVLKRPYITYRVFQQTAAFWPATYANDHFTRQGGDCHADAGAFAYLCRAMGYTDVYVCLDSDGVSAQGHSWAQVNGLCYDPLFAEAKDYASYYGVPVSSYPLRAITQLEVAVDY